MFLNKKGKVKLCKCQSIIFQQLFSYYLMNYLKLYANKPKTRYIFITTNLSKPP